MELGMLGAEYGMQVNYFLLDRLGLQVSLGSFQSLSTDKIYSVRNSSYMLASINLFGDMIKTKREHRLRLSAGCTYLRGDLAMGAWYVDDTDDGIQNYRPIGYDVDIYNTIGVNAKISYLFPISDKWFGGVNLKFYDEIDGIFCSVAALDFSIGFNF
jgi:hypothetical protein